MRKENPFFELPRLWRAIELILAEEQRTIARIVELEMFGARISALERSALECAAVHRRCRGLEREVGRLRGEVDAIKAALRALYHATRREARAVQVIQ